MKFPLLSFAALLAAALAGCGGGGSSSTPNTSPNTGQPPVVAAPPPYTFTPGTLTASFVEGYPVTVDLSARQTVAFTGTVYFKVVQDTNVVDPVVPIQAELGSTVQVTATPLATGKPGHYTGNITINVCKDPNCVTHLQGSPFKLPYDIEVIPAAGKTTAYNLSPLAMMGGAGNWSTFQGNNRHTGYAPVSLDPAAFNRRWKIDTSSVNGIQRSPSDITTADGRLYTAYGVGGSASSFAFVAYNEADGSEVWSRNFEGGINARTNPPAVVNGKVYGVAGAEAATAMYIYDAATGTQLYKSPMGAQRDTYLAPTISGNSVYTNGGTYGGMYSFNASNGVQNYFSSLPPHDGWTPAIDSASNNMYSYLADMLYVLDPDTGNLRAYIPDKLTGWFEQSRGAPVVGNGGLVFAGRYNGMLDSALIAFDVAAKQVRWSVQGAYPGNPAYAAPFLFVANNKQGRLEALNESDGSVAWSWTAPAGEKFVGDVIATQNIVFVSTDGAVYAIDRSSHQRAWSYPASGTLSISMNGILYIKGKTSITAINLR